MTGARRRARGIALQALYEIDITGHDVEEVLPHVLTGERITEDNAEFIRELVRGVIQNKKKLDGHIGDFAPSWPVKQIAVIDRNILRLAIFEILLDNKVPVRAVINEAVELAKIFGSDSSSRFVNGVLGSVSTLTQR